MPPHLKFKGGELKYLLRSAVHDLLPPAVYQRKDKMGFPVPLHLWSRGKSRGFFEDVLLSSAARERGLFDPVEVGKLLSYDGAFSRRTWGLLSLELWHRQFIDAD
jgi:asparagine synthase (glutamine-hydrolysing)